MVIEEVTTAGKGLKQDGLFTRMDRIHRQKSEI